MDKQTLNQFTNISQAISSLLFPHAEIVVHNFKTGKIAAIQNNLSKRKVGDESLLEEELKDFSKLPDIFPIYFMTNWEGRRMKCVSTLIRDPKNKPVGLMCINLDLSKWEEMQQIIAGFMQGSDQKPEVLFKDDWREKINIFVTGFLKREGKTLKTLSKEKMRELINALHAEGAFKAKNAAAYIADVLNLSRATIYNYLR